MDYIEEVERLLFKFWEELPQPKETYTMWFYHSRYDVIRWLFSKKVKLPEVEKCTNANTAEKVQQSFIKSDAEERVTMFVRNALNEQTGLKI